MNININSLIKRWQDKYITAPRAMKQLSKTHPDGVNIIHKVKDSRLTYLDNMALIELYQTIIDIENRNLDGIFIEAGVALGGSAIVITAAKRKTRPFKLYDTFEMIPPPSTKDSDDVHLRWLEISSGKAQGIQGDLYYGYDNNLLEHVKANFSKFGFNPEDSYIHFIQGLFQDKMQIDEPVAFAHLDCDWYQSVWTCLERIEPNLIPGGILIIDDYEHWSGCRQAVDDYFSHNRNQYIFKQRSRLHILKTQLE